MRWFDPHAHLDTRPTQDLPTMATAGITDVLTLAHDPLRMSTADVSLDHFHHLMENEVLRGTEHGIRVHVALGMHPRAIPSDWKRVLGAMETLLKHPSVIAIGEIGLETASDIEEEVFRRQLRLVGEFPAIVHTPRENKEEVTQRTIEIIEETGVDPQKIIIDHASTDTVEDALGLGAHAGLTVQKGKLTHDDLTSIIETLSREEIGRVVVNSDLSQAPSDPLTVARVAYELRQTNIEEEVILSVCSNNSRDFLLE